MTKRALIVDDSKTAQARLRKMLEKFDVEVDTTDSAEEALGYLSYKQPTVIFLDHHMDGMSGLSALKIIKSNPATALIPVVMYTSEQGDVYVGQARALGALDILSKEVIKASSIEKVLSSLGLNKDKAANDTPPQTPARRQTDIQPAVQPRRRDTAAVIEKLDFAEEHPAASSAPYSARADLNQVQAQVGKLFEIHIAKVRQEIEDSTKFLMRRLSKEIQEGGGPKVGTPLRAAKTEAPADPELVIQEASKAAPVAKTPFWLPVFLLLSLLGIAYLLYSSHMAQKALESQLTTLAEQSQLDQESTQLALSVLAEKGGEKVSKPDDSRIMLDALGWAVNVNPLTPFGEKPLNDQRIYMLGELLALLKTANFAGTIFIDIHLGNYCVIKTPAGGWMLPEPESNIEDCVMLADEQLDIALNDQVSIGFLNYLHSTPVLTEGSIDVEMASLGYDSPKFSYPPATSAISAGQWNSAAAQNSRLSFSFSPN